MSDPVQASARYDGPVSHDLIPQAAAHAREAELAVEESADAMVVRTPAAVVSLERDASGLSLTIEAADAVGLQQFREYMLYILDHVAPGLTPRMDWRGDIARNTAPPGFAPATVRRVWRVAPSFLRVELESPGTRRLAEGRGMHFSLLLPPAGRTPVWPRLDDNGRTLWPRDADSLHRAAYTFVDLDPAAGRFTFDVFEHDGGRTTEWARRARAGDPVGVAGPGSGDFPPGRDLLIAGDETALPAIRRILALSGPDRRGDVLIEVGNAADICEMPRPEGLRLSWLLRARGEALWDRLAGMEPPAGPDRYVWIAAEKDLVRKAKARFRDGLGVGPDEGYFAYYWTA